MKLKPRILSVVVIITFLTLLILFGMKQDMDSKVQESSPNVTERGVMAWLDAFSKKDFSTCDFMITDKSEGLHTLQLSIIQEDSRYYDLALEKLVACISAIQVKSIDRADGVVNYTVTVTYTPYTPLGDLVYDKSALDSVKDKYIKGEMSATDFQNELSRVYYEIFCNSCFQTDDSMEARQKDLILSEKEENGVTCVSNTVSFVDNLLADSNIEKNLAIYEKDVKEKVANIIKADVTP